MTIDTLRASRKKRRRISSRIDLKTIRTTSDGDWLTI